LDRSDSLNRILPVLREMDIDQFHMYDSFWSADLLGADSEAQKVLPPDWLKTVKAKEMEIIDSTLSYCFACQWTGICRNSVTKIFRVVNSTSSDKICTLCETGSGSRMPWMGCMLKLEHLQLSHGKLKSLTSDFFPPSMTELKILDFSHNQIGKIGVNAFKNVPNMERLDLSNNVIEHLDHTFGRSTELKYLDVSHNSITMVGTDLIPLMPKLKSINLAYNLIVNFTLSDWQRAPKTIRNIDLRENPIHCDCSLRWLNATLAIHVAIPGNCATPDEFKESRFRVASRHMAERCDINGQLGTRKRARTS